MSTSPRPDSVRDSTASPTSATRLRLHTFGSVMVLLAAAALPRLACMRGEAWFDEIWTWDICHRLTWPGGLFSQLRSENNHYLNTLVIWLLRDQSWVYWRVPAVCCGLATVWIAWRLGRTHRVSGNRAGWIAGILTASSYLMVHYSSEARGYAYAVFFAALAYQVLELPDACNSNPGGYPADSCRRRRPAWLFWIACCGGWLSQPIFLGCFAAMAVWFYLGLEDLRPGTARLFTLLKYFLPPALFFGVLYTVDLRHAINVGGDQLPLSQVLIETLSLLGGGPFGGWGAYAVAGLVLAAFLYGLWVLAREGDGRWIFYMLAVAVMPVGLILVLRRDVVYPRYFLIAAFFLIQAVAVGLADLTRRGRGPVGLAAIGLAAAIWGNSLHVARLAELGRGGYLPVLGSLLSGEPSDVIQLRSDSDLRQALMFKYYLPLVNLNGKTLRYVARDQVPAGGTTWLLTHTIDVTWQPHAACAVRGSVYDLRLFRPYAGLSGWGLALYRRRPTETGPPPGAVDPLPKC